KSCGQWHSRVTRSFGCADSLYRLLTPRRMKGESRSRSCLYPPNGCKRLARPIKFEVEPLQSDIGVPGTLQPILTTDQIQRRVTDIARQINTDYAGRTLHAVCVLEDGFIFMADIVRQLNMPVLC